MVDGLDHIAVCVRDARKGMEDLSRVLGVDPGDVRELPEHGIMVRFLRIGDTEVELVQPLDPQGSLGRFLERRGEGLHHICFQVKDIEAALQHMEKRGITSIDRIPRKGATGDLIAFLHPKDTHGVLIELIEKRAELRNEITERAGHRAHREHGEKKIK